MATIRRPPNDDMSESRHRGHPPLSETARAQSWCATGIIPLHYALIMTSKSLGTRLSRTTERYKMSSIPTVQKIQNYPLLIFIVNSAYLCFSQIFHSHPRPSPRWCTIPTTSTPTLGPHRFIMTQTKVRSSSASSWPLFYDFTAVANNYKVFGSLLIPLTRISSSNLWWAVHPADTQCTRGLVLLLPVLPSGLLTIPIP